MYDVLNRTRLDSLMVFMVRGHHKRVVRAFCCGTLNATSTWRTSRNNDREGISRADQVIGDFRCVLCRSALQTRSQLHGRMLCVNESLAL